MPSDENAIKSKIARSAAVIAGLSEQSAEIHRAIGAIRSCLAAGGTLYTAGNGGSAAEALHLAEELIGKYKNPRRPLRAICLNADPTALTCIANDFGYDHVFARQLEGLSRGGDCFVAFSTSGNSANVRIALERARAMKVTTIGLLGKTGGPCAHLCDHPLIVRADETEHIQEAHQVILHLILEGVESNPPTH
ncbi:MAG: SIS domain-containing protein [Phycisphaeraceae bacterium]|nr:SIS domain-containing protein [Phycisphaerales bacterium]MCB9843971.1 SIS domain-containing protein [Phycisphaeraceae bacterium]